jgi:hypothetical protein
MKIRERLWEGLFANPFAWLLFAAFLIAAYGNWHLAKQLDRVCELWGEHDVVVDNPTTDREELDNICADQLADPEPAE